MFAWDQFYIFNTISKSKHVIEIALRLLSIINLYLYSKLLKKLQ